MIIDKFKEVVKNRHQYAKDWKARTGGKVFGYLCCYNFEEIPYAAGVLPVRILGRNEPQEVSAPYIYSSMFCPFSRNALAEGLEGKYEYIDGIFMGQSCTHIRHTFDAWRWYVNPNIFAWFVAVPHQVETKKVKDFVTAELRDFKAGVEKYMNKPISDEALWNALKVYDHNRDLMTKLYELRKPDPPYLTGEEMMYIQLAAMMMDKVEHSKLLEQALKELPKRKDMPKAGVRLILIGGELDDPDILRVIEKEGANVVADDACVGSRYFYTTRDPKDTDPISAIAGRYMSKPSCPVKDTDRHRRKEHVKTMLDEYKIQAAWFIQQKFCDPHEFDIPPLIEWLKEKGIPSYRMELDTTIPEGQLSTRAGAFLETMTLEFM